MFLAERRACWPGHAESSVANFTGRKRRKLKGLGRRGAVGGVLGARERKACDLPTLAGRIGF